MSVPTNDSAKIGLVSEIKIVSSRMNLSATSGHAERVDLNMLQNRNHPSQFRWLMHKVHSMLSLAVRKTTVLCSVRNCARANLQLQHCQVSMCVSCVFEVLLPDTPEVL